MRKPASNTLKDLQTASEDFPLVKLVLYGGVAIISLYALGKLFSASAYCIRGYNEMYSAIIRK